MTYRELDERSNRLARCVDRAGCGTGGVRGGGVGAVGGSRCWRCGRWRRPGRRCVPVDPGYPARADRAHAHRFAVRCSGSTVAAHRDRLPDAVAWLVLDEPGTVAAVAAVSGAPVTDADRRAPLRLDHAGVSDLHLGVDRARPRVWWSPTAGSTISRPSCGSGARRDRRSRVLHFASPSFDAAMLELSAGVRGGGDAGGAPPGVAGRAGAGAVAGAPSGSPTRFLTPAALATVDPEGLDGLRARRWCGGEACPPGLVTRWAPGRAMFNAYGPTEATVAANVSDPLVAGGPVTVGRAGAWGARGGAGCAVGGRCRWGWWGSCMWRGAGWRGGIRVGRG